MDSAAPHPPDVLVLHHARQEAGGIEHRLGMAVTWPMQTVVGASKPATLRWVDSESGLPCRVQGETLKNYLFAEWIGGEQVCDATRTSGGQRLSRLSHEPPRTSDSEPNEPGDKRQA